MTETNPYKQYADNRVLNSNPLGLVVALYEGAIDSTITARSCLASGDILGRGKAVNKVVNILTELMSALDHEKGREVSENLGKLYDYMQRRVLEAHLKKKAEPLMEVEKLLNTILDGWRFAGHKLNPGAQCDAPAAALPHQQNSLSDQHYSPQESAPYGGYLSEFADYGAREAYSF